MNHLTGPEQVAGSDACTGRADIERLGQLNELRAREVHSPQEYRHLEANAWCLPPLGGVQLLTSLCSACFQRAPPVGTSELVREKEQIRCHQSLNQSDWQLLHTVRFNRRVRARSNVFPFEGGSEGQLASPNVQMERFYH